MSISFEIDTSRLDAIIRNLDPRAEAAVNDAGEDFANMVRAEVVSMGVVDSERLLKSVEWKPSPSSTGVHNGVVVVGAKSDSGFPYPIAQHEGWTDKSEEWHPGRPFMRVAGEKFKPYFRKNYFGRLFD